jgi:hypothetical protein
MAELKNTVPLLLAALLGAAILHLLTPEPVAAQSSDGGRRYVAVTGPYQEGVSVLYVLDQVDQRLAVYEARGGAANSRRVALVGVRNVALDTELDGYNDESDYSFKDLEELLERRGVVNK